MTAPAERPLPDRLLCGAGVLGRLYRDGERCASWGWGAACTCPGKTEFCKAKVKWVGLAKQTGREIGNGQFDVVLAMTTQELEQLKVVLLVELKDGRRVRVGANEELKPVNLPDLLNVPSEAVPLIVRILDQFPGSVIVDGPGGKP